jgi:signal peptide peptidase SppA
MPVPHDLRRIANRIMTNKAHPITADAAIAVMGGELAARLNVARIVDNLSGVVFEVGAVAPPLSERRVAAERSVVLAGVEFVPAAKDARSVGAPSRDHESARLFAFEPQSGIAYIPIEGELVHKYGHLDPYSGLTGYDGIKAKVHAAAEDRQVKGILYDYDTPGGELFGVKDTAEAIFLARQAKPSWALINEMALSAGYWLASAAHNVFAPTTADTGSIGVVMMHADWSGKLKDEGVTVTLIHSGARKIDGHPFGPLPEEVLARFQGEVDNVRTLFASDVARNRKLSVAAMLDTEADVFTSVDALAARLIDAVASEDEVFEEFAARLARPQPAALPSA